MLDLRLPVGIFFLLVGAILAVDGMVQPVHPEGVDFVLNLYWGGFLFLFGVAMSVAGWIGQKKQSDTTDSTAHVPQTDLPTQNRE